MFKFISLICLTCFFSGSLFAQGVKVEGFEFVKELQGYHEYKLSKNNLQVILKEDKSVPSVMFMVTYKVGSRNETIGNTGATHLLEHLMFKGTAKFNKASGNSYDKLIEGVGGLVNATTWLDRTNYYGLVPNEYLERIIEVEADRMRNLKILKTDKESEMTVVRNEFEIGENNPQGALDKIIWATAYQAHPYHHSTIGWRSDIENVSVERLQEFYDTYYWADNATVTVAGNFDKAKTLEYIYKYYGEIPKSPKPLPVVYTTEPVQEGARRAVLKRTGTTGVVGVAHKTPKGLDKESYSFAIIEKILTSGKTSRLYKAFIDKGLASNIACWYSQFNDGGLFPIYVTLSPATTHEKAEKILLDEYEKIVKEGFTEDELKRAKSQIKTDISFGMDGPFNTAGVLNESIALGDWTYVLNFVENASKISLEEVNAVFKKYFVEDQSTTAWFIPIEDDKAATGSIQDKPRPHYYRDPSHEHEEIKDLNAQLLQESKFKTEGIADQIKDRKIENIRLMTLKTGIKDVVTVSGSILAGDYFSIKENSMTAKLTAAMLDQGTLVQDKFAISEALGNIGASISFSAGNATLNFNAKCLKEDVPMVFKLIAEQLRKPAFKDTELESLKKRFTGQLKQQMENTNVRARISAMASIFPEGHPNFPISLEQMLKDIENVSIEDIKKFHATYYGNKSMNLVVVGDVDDSAIEKAVKSNFSAWNSGVTFPKYSKASIKAVTNKNIVVTMPDKPNVSVIMVTPIMLQADEKDYAALETATSILGGKFTARLMQTVRDKEGLTYGIYSSLTGATFADGAWVLTASFSPSLLEKGLISSNRELNKWIDEGITKEELESEKIYAAGDAKVGISNSGAIAGQILNLAQRNAPLKLIDTSPEQIKALTLEQVNNAIKKYVNVKNIQTVLAGSIDNELKELKKDKK